MRPIDLIPSDERHVERGAFANGAFGWSIVGALVLAVIGVVVLATTSSAISEREAEVADVTQREADARAEAERLRPYIDFTATAEARKVTVESLASGRFDWERVMRELSLIMPDEIVLDGLVATVVPGVSVSGGASVGLRSEVEGPALELTGCGVGDRNESQAAVARFISALYDMDGVTRVAMPDAEVGGNERCGGGEQVSVFEAVVAFDYAPIPGEDVALIPPEPEPEAVDPDTVPAGEGRDPTDPSAGGDEARDSVAEAESRATAATETFIPGG